MNNMNIRVSDRVLYQRVVDTIKPYGNRSKQYVRLFLGRLTRLIDEYGVMGEISEHDDVRFFKLAQEGDLSLYLWEVEGKCVLSCSLYRVVQLEHVNGKQYWRLVELLVRRMDVLVDELRKSEKDFSPIIDMLSTGNKEDCNEN